ncbi:hypothetical protein FM119_03180 [Mycetocola reblochoni REB411]|uniref:Uncharacterized protein n=1 Tax=Mycetocola reblochoni REB411 TaxID=1255698 RepID=A0A1R4IRZ8_9MICO|nr:hypothetical protein FM119_03180 [Mycetocola reblochoni REB411]
MRLLCCAVLRCASRRRLLAVRGAWQVMETESAAAVSVTESDAGRRDGARALGAAAVNGTERSG